MREALQIHYLTKRLATELVRRDTEILGIPEGDELIEWHKEKVKEIEKEIKEVLEGIEI